MNRNKKLYVNAYIIQAQPTAVVNADETGAPKTAMQGGIERLRLSAQCLKKAMRTYLKEHYGDDSIRTNGLKEYLTKCLVEERNLDAKEAASIVSDFMKVIGISSSKDDRKDTSTFFNQRQIDRMEKKINDLCKEGKSGSDLSEEEKKEIIVDLNSTPSMSQLFFGRMFASNPDLDYEACCSVAHAVSVNRYEKTFDLFTNKSDSLAGSSRGAAFLDTRILGSGLLYRYATLDLSDGSSIVKEPTIDEAEAAAAFVDSFSMSFPYGGSHAYAPYTVPERILVEIRTDRPINYNPAYDEAISGENLTAKANEALDAYRDKIGRMYGRPEAVFDTKDGLSLSEICEHVKEVVKKERA